MGPAIKFGVIGCGLMGKEFASAASRWCHLAGDIPRTQIVAVCDTNPANHEWFGRHLPDLKYRFSDYRELLALPEVEAVYCAVPHSLHEAMYIDIIRAGKHLLGEKPFGIDQAANAAILAELALHPKVFARCSSEFPYYPAAHILAKWIGEGKFGRIIEARFGMRHSSDMDLDKPINWKRIAKINGEYGCMGDLGIHTEHLAFRAGWRPVDVCAKLSKLVESRPDGKGGMAACDTWDNATLLCGMRDAKGAEFPATFEMKRMAPASTNAVFYEIYGMDLSARFTTDDPNALVFTTSWGKEQAWSRIVVGHKPVFPTITGGIFEFGFSDAILQMWAAFVAELCGLPVGYGCFTPEETGLSHALQTAALASQRGRSVETVA
ncbi:MAG: Gfo/Idh/MocA family protein [Rectinemataceae bacterium]